MKQNKLYQVPETFNSNLLYVANINHYVINQNGTKEVVTLNNKLLFVTVGDNIYREIFSGIIVNNNNQDINFLTDIKFFNDYFPGCLNNQIPKISLIYMLDEINNQKLLEKK
ncbi:MAG: hypothetical protein J5892_01300 [Bacilli bacterium]|nr:hypothetical protein [Bacilli bacterium]